MQTNLKTISTRVRTTMQVLPYKVGVLMVAFTKERFRNANWLDTYTEPWQPRKRRSKWSGKKDNRGRKVGTKSGRMGRGNRIVNTTPNSVTIGNDVPYAAAHNDGLRVGQIQRVRTFVRKQRKGRKVIGTVVVKAHTRKINQNIPRRRFMGESKYLNMQINRLIAAEINKTFRV